MGFHIRLILVTVVHGLFSPYSSTQSLVLNYFQPVVQPFVNQSFTAHFGLQLSPSQFAWLWSLLAASNSVGTLLGSFAITYFLERFGRRDTVMVLRNALAVVAGALQTLAYPLNSFELLTLGHLLSGVCSALNAGLILYITECVPDQYRGVITLTTGLGGRILVLMASVLALPDVLGNEYRWMYFPLAAAAAPVVHLFFAFLPRSPKFLYLSTKIEQSPQMRREKSMHSIRFYHGKNVDSSEILDKYDKEAQLGNFRYATKLSDIWASRHLREPFLICVVAATAPAFSGLTMRDQYSNGMLVSFGVPADQTMVAFILLHLVSIPFCILAPYLVEKVGRRPLLLGCVSSALLSVLGMFAAELLETTMGADNSVGTAIGLVGFALGTFSSIFGLVTLPYLLIGEMCPQATRAKTMSTAVSISISATILVVFIFPPLNAAIGAYAYLPIAAAEAVCLLLLYKYLPETKNRSVDEIVADFIDPAQPIVKLSEKTPLLAVEPA